MTARTTAQRPGTPVWRDFWTTDAEGTAALLTGLFGYTVAQDGPEAGYCLASGPRGAVCGIGPATEEEAPRDVASLFLATDDVRATHARALELGAREAIPPMEIDPTGTFSTVMDPTGALVSFWQAGEQLGYAAVDEPGYPCWQSLYTTDVERAQDFYGRLFDLTWEEGPVEGCFVAKDGEDALFDAAPVGEHERPVWIQYALVEDLDAVITRARELGIIVVATTELPFGRGADLQTPGGASFGVFEDSQGEAA